MADRVLMERLAAGVFDPPVAYRDLADFHLDFARLADEAPEAELRERAERRSGCCAVIGDSGAGKSSLIAAVAASLEPTRFPVRVQGVTTDDVLTREGFALHLGRETLRALEEMPLAGPGGRRLRPAREGLAAGRHQRSGGGSAQVAVPLTPEFRAQVATTAREVTEERDPVRVGQAVAELVAVTEDLGRRLLLVVEDTDVFMPPDPINDAERERPRRFVDQVLGYLAREFPSSALVAVNTRYAGLLPRAVVAQIHVPRIQPHGMALLIEHYAARAGLRLRAGDVIEPEALAYVAGRYAETRDLRRTLELLHRAARKVVGEDRGGRITVGVLHGL
ncbi:MAG: AAA family ATPase [Solirubrobacterales bacterium]|nr:AAA family ATPase [Solirubrobacterales bacterium]